MKYGWDVLFFAMVAFVVLGFSYFGWYIGRAVSYKYAYQELVKKEIRNMVKQESLK